MTFNLITTARAVPDQIITNSDLAKIMPTSDEWIKQRTGIERRHLTSTETTESLCIDVAQQLVQANSIGPKQIDLIVVATMSPTYSMPSVAATVQGAIGAENAATLDVNAACTGFVYAMAVAHDMAVAKGYQNVIVIGGEVMSKYVNWQDRSTAVLFGDGAAGVLLALNEDGQDHYLGDAFKTFGEKGRSLMADFRPNNSPFAKPVEADSYLTMDGHQIYNFVIKKAPVVIEEVLQKTGLTLPDIDWVVFHQANARIIQQLSKKLGLTAQQCPINIDEYGNVAAASEPLVLNDLVASNQLKPGDKVLLCGFGGGLTIGASIFDYYN